MDAKEAVKRAKEYVADLFAEEKIVNLGLEEVDFSPSGGCWEITVGFSRPWNSPTTAAALVGAGLRRAYRVVRIRDADGEILSVRRRENLDA